MTKSTEVIDKIVQRSSVMRLKICYMNGVNGFTTKPAFSHRDEIGTAVNTPRISECGKCKHITGLIYYVNHIESFTKIDQEQLWGHVSAKRFAKENYSKGKYFYEMYSPTKNVNMEPVEVKVSELKCNSSLKLMLMTAEKGTIDFEIETCVDSLLDKVKKQLITETSQACVNEIFMFQMDHPVYKSNFEMNENDKQYYEKQSNCNKWFKARQLRISASKNVHSIKQNEKVAKELYEKLYEVEIIKLGVLVSEKQPWLCASLDGLVYNIIL
ncbi:hypothetical protein PV327_010936 [Microctonus hyperodae]|uniref:Uncharacterized protein n=1 Tax=Microctonus hyperodae TaxID=165561 RepID=A0AA39F0H2_MICHY|nr:hypothetical protein PV327_010936 [Microctonus hyperodae]